MATTAIVLGAVLVLYGACVIAWSLWSRESSVWTHKSAWAYKGVMFIALGVIFLLANAQSPSGTLHAVAVALVGVVAWSGWKHVTLLRQANRAGEEPRIAK